MYGTVKPEDKILSQEVIEAAIKMIKNNMTPGNNSIMAELMKNGG